MQAASTLSRREAFHGVAMELGQRRSQPEAMWQILIGTLSSLSYCLHWALLCSHGDLKYQAYPSLVASQFFFFLSEWDRNEELLLKFAHGL